MAAVFRKKYIRQGIFIIAGILFLLSLFEWTGDQRFGYSEVTRYSEQLSSDAVKERAETKSPKGFVYYFQAENTPEVSDHAFTVYSSITCTSLVKKFILLRCIRV